MKVTRHGKCGNMPELDYKYWHGKNVLLTGHTGFKGTWMTALLKILGANIHGFSLGAYTTPNLFDVVQAESLCSSHCVGDIREFNSLSDMFETVQPDIMIHMAAQPIVSKSFLNPIETFETNIMGTVHFLECVRRMERGIALVISSDKCYHNANDYKSFVETDALGGADPYSASKAGTELVVNSWRKSFFDRPGVQIKLSSVRAGNVIGGGDWSENRLIPDAARAFSKNLHLPIRNPDATRPWQHVLEPVAAYLLLIQEMAQSDNLSQAWNVGPMPAKTETVLNVTRQFQSHWSTDSQLILQPNSNMEITEAHTLSLDSSKFSKHLGWRPVLDLAEAIKWTAYWYRTYYEHGSTVAGRLLLKQITEYLGRFSASNGG